ncbi:PREDICTED: spondin-1-like isoform X2 [Acropora digitifera]|uniref:spondin-1-like isoform X2 n=1 Tax=Acropora digitifera TaxID=70779 RepID=UPI00077A6044|nr:PREDICTED: spondin-1-like isoform X2 [Acropora digitifera]
MDAAMISAKFLVVFILLIIFQDGAKSWRRRRRRRYCPRQDCQVSSWYSWNSCSASRCGRQGSQSRSRSVTSQASCGGSSCPDLYESRQCYGSTSENCQLSSWSQWGACPTMRCGSSAMQTSTRHRITTEKCGGWCTSTFRKTRMCLRGRVNCELSSWSEWSTCDGTVCTAGRGAQVSFRNKLINEICGGTCTSTLRMTRSCSNSITRKAVECQVSPWSQWGNCTRTSCQLSGFQASTRNKTVKEECKGTCKYALHQKRSCAKPELPCFNGGKYKPNITGCVCMQGYSGVCCEKSPQGNTKSGISKTITIGASVGGGSLLLIILLVAYCCCTNSVCICNGTDWVCNICNCKHKIHPSTP